MLEIEERPGLRPTGEYGSKIMYDFIDTIWQTTQIARSQIIDPSNDELKYDEYSCTLCPGYFGINYSDKRILVIGHFPAGGTESYSNSKYYIMDNKFYGSIIEFKKSSKEDRESKYFRMIEITKEYMKSWDIYRLFKVIFKNTSLCIDDVCYINAVPFRIYQNRKPNKSEIKRAWDIYSGYMIEMLNPKIIICLGIATGEIITQHLKKLDKVIIFRRRIGDKSIDPSVFIECAKIKNMICSIGAGPPADGAH
jgi:hypothetical protein